MEKPSFHELFQTHKKSANRLKKSSCQERSSKLLALKKWIHSHKDSIREAVFKDLSKPPTEVDISEVSVVLQEISHALKHLKKWIKPKKVSTPLSLFGTKGYIHYEPLGTSLIISPWNYPFNLAVGPLVSAISAGCTVILKPSELAPATSALLKRMVKELFAPEEVMVVEGGKEEVQKLLALPFDKLFFTGSPATGRIMMEAAAKHHMEITLELGGKSPVLIDRGYSPKDAAQKIAWAKWLNCGQTCIAPDYVLVNDEIYDTFKQILMDTVLQMFPSKSNDISACMDYGRIINAEHHQRLQYLLEDARNKGATCLMGGDYDQGSYYFGPTILEGLEPNMDIMREEIFGPILPIIKYTLLEEAVDFINELPKPLAVYVFTEEAFVKDFVLENTSSGGVCFNDCAIQFGHTSLPFGGTNKSGMGKSHGYFGFKAFSNERSVLHQKSTINLLRNIYPPYSFKAKKIADLFLKWI